MMAGIWLLFYDIAAADRDHYVDWFHRRQQFILFGYQRIRSGRQSQVPAHG